MAGVFEDKLTPQMRAHLHGIDVQPLSRIDAARLATRAMPHIGSIELITSDVFDKVYDPLYVSMFPRRTERERSDLIVERLAKQSANERHGLAPYRLIGVRDPSGAAIGAAHISVLSLPGGQFAVPYLQYIYVRAENRRQDMSEVLHAMVLAVAAADAAKDGRTVPLTLFETEPPGYGDDEVSQAYSRARAQIHDRTGGAALVLIRDRDGKELSAHVQPGLEVTDPPLTLVWVVRPSPAPGRPYDIRDVGKDLVAAYYQSMRDEGFPEQNIRLAEQMVAERCRGSVFRLTSLNNVVPYTD